jgi:hypothetical protein
MRFCTIVALAVSLTAPTVAAYSDEIDTDHLFAFSQGTDIPAVGTKELESEASGRFGKRGDTYTAYSQEIEVGYVPLKNLHVFAGSSLAYFDIAGVPELDDRERASFGELSFEARYRLMDRARSPFGLAMQVETGWAAIDEVSGEPADSYGAAFAVLADKELVKELVVSVINIVYEPEATRSRVTGEWEKESGLEITGAVLAQVIPNLFLGVGAQHLRAYEGLGFDSLAGQATFVGPNLCWHPKDLWVIAGWSTQVAGRASGILDSLDLENFERHTATLTVGFDF